MRAATLNKFFRYLSVGVLNTMLHWCTFFIAYYWLSFNQAYSNFIAFSLAVTLSFIVNSRYTFESQATGARYLKFVSFMGGVSFATGYFSDKAMAPPLITVLLFSSISLVAGFIYSNKVVFREKD